jgi:hypothetical protein
VRYGGSHSSEHGEYCFLGCDTLQPGEILPLARRNPLPPSSLWKCGDEDKNGDSRFQAKQCHNPEDLNKFQIYLPIMRFEVLVVVNMSSIVFWDVTLCSLVESYNILRENLQMKAAGFP